MRKLAALLFVAFLLFPASAFASQNEPKQKPAGLTVTPFLQNIAIDPTSPTTTFKVQVLNDAKYEQKLVLSAIDFGSLDETGGVAFAGASHNELIKKYGLSPWLSLDKNELTLKAGERVDITATIKNDDSMSPGGHYAAILVSTKARGDSKNNINLQQTVSTLVLATKLGGIKYDLKLDSLSHTGNIFSPPDKFTLRFKNTGNVHIVPRGIVLIKDSKNNVMARGIINEDSEFILPETYRQVFVNPKQVKPYPFNLVNSYKIEINYRYDDLERFATKTYNVKWVNWQPIAAIIIAVSALIFAFIKNYHKKLNLKVLFR